MNVKVMGLMLSKVLERSRPLSLVELARTENDPMPGPLAVMSVITADADAADTDPPKIRPAISDFVFMFILCSKKDLKTIFIAGGRWTSFSRSLTDCPWLFSNLL